MARQFLASSTQRGDSAGTVAHGIGTGDFTMACWANPVTASNTGSNAIWSVGSFLPCMFYCRSGVGTAWVIYCEGDRVFNTVLTNATWVHLMAIRASGTITGYVNGVAEATTHGSIGSNILNAACQVNVQDSGGNSLGNGSVAAIGLWNIALDATARNQLAVLKYAPKLVQPANLKWSIRMLGTASPEPDDSGGGQNLTLSGSPTQVSDPPGIVDSLAQEAIVSSVRVPNRLVGPRALRLQQRRLPFPQHLLAPVTSSEFSLRINVPNRGVGPRVLRLTQRAQPHFILLNNAPASAGSLLLKRRKAALQ